MTADLIVNGLMKRFGGLVAVDRIDLAVPPGQRHAVIGPNGAGKSTLLSMIAGGLRPTAGTVELLGRNVTGWPMHRIARLGVGRTFQHSGQFAEETLLDNCLLAACASAGRLARLGRDAELCRVAAGALDVVGLGDRSRDPAGALSHGEARQLEIAMALAARPRLLLADEPLAGLSEHDRERVGGLLRALSRDVTMLFIEHDLEFVLGTADEVTVLDIGRAISRGTPAQVRNDERVVAVYLGDSATSARADDRAARPSSADGPAASALEVRGLRSGYGGAVVVDGVDLDAAEGRVLAVLGRNGMGKTTLLRTIMGHIEARAGGIRLGGRDMSAMRASDRARAGLALVPQGRGILPGLTLAEQLLVGRRSGRWTEARVYEWFPVLAARRDQLATTLSGGEQQMLAIGRALLRNPAVIMLDEPSEGLAPVLVRRVGEIVRQLAAEGECIVLAEQNVRMAVSVADDVVILERGRVTFRGTASELREDHKRQQELLGL